MTLKCVRCGKIVEVFEYNKQLVFVPHKLIGNDIYCEDCLENIEENRSFFLRTKKFFRINKAKVILTIMLYASMIIYNIIFFKPLSDYNMVVEGFVQFGYIINLPILLYTHSVNVSSPLLTMLFTVSSIFIVVFWNYFISCFLYHIYKKIEGF